jgi:hypothetical protein
LSELGFGDSVELVFEGSEGLAAGLSVEPFPAGSLPLESSEDSLLPFERA